MEQADLEQRVWALVFSTAMRDVHPSSFHDFLSWELEALIGQQFDWVSETGQVRKVVLARVMVAEGSHGKLVISMQARGSTEGEVISLSIQRPDDLEP